MNVRKAKKTFKALAKAAYSSQNPHICQIEIDFAPEGEKAFAIVALSAYLPKRVKVRVSKALMTRLITVNKIKNERARNFS